MNTRNCPPSTSTSYSLSMARLVQNTKRLAQNLSTDNFVVLQVRPLSKRPKRCSSCAIKVRPTTKEQRKQLPARTEISRRIPSSGNARACAVSATKPICNATAQFEALITPLIPFSFSFHAKTTILVAYILSVYSRRHRRAFRTEALKTTASTSLIQIEGCTRATFVLHAIILLMARFSTTSFSSV